MSSFLNPPRGKSETPLFSWLVLVSSFGLWIVLGGLVIGFGNILLADADPLLTAYLPDFLRFVVLWWLVWSAARLLGREPRSLFSQDGSFSRRWLLVGFGGWFGMQALLSGVGYLLTPTDYSWSFTPANLPAALLVAAVFLPVQTSAEELFFRSWIPQTLALSTQRVAVVTIGSAFLFALPHLGNPEVADQLGWAILAYGSLGAAWTYSAIRAGNLAIAIGAHLANNFFGLLIVGYANSALPALSIWTTPAADMPVVAVVGACSAAAWCGLLRWLTRQPGRF